MRQRQQRGNTLIAAIASVRFIVTCKQLVNWWLQEAEDELPELVSDSETESTTESGKSDDDLSTLESDSEVDESATDSEESDEEEVAKTIAVTGRSLNERVGTLFAALIRARVATTYIQLVKIWLKNAENNVAPQVNGSANEERDEATQATLKWLHCRRRIPQ